MSSKDAQRADAAHAGYFGPVWRPRPFDARQNVEAGTKLLKQLPTKYNNDVSLALAAYNAGEGRVDRDGAVPQIPETKNYVNDIRTIQAAHKIGIRHRV